MSVSLPQRLAGMSAPVVCLIFVVVASVTAAEGPILLRDWTDKANITFTHTDGSSGRRYIVETVSAGLALFDYDRDGDIDIYFLNGALLKGSQIGVAPRNALYRNDGNFHFTEVTAEANVGDTGYGLGVAVGDYDNDGYPDMFLNNYGPNVIYRNNGDGTFSNVTTGSTLAGPPDSVGAGASFLDADADGDLDLYVSSYLDFSYDTHIHNVWLGFHVYPGPDHYAPTSDYFYRNNGDGTFTDVSQESGIATVRGRGMGLVTADYDNDGDTDILVANDSTPNFLLDNDGTGKFSELGLFAGVAYDLFGSLHGSMGIDCGDYNNDGLLDFYQTSYQGQSAILYQNLGAGLLEDVTLSAQAGDGTLPHVTWGNGLVDFDNDGHRDIFIACGHLYDNVDLFSDVTSYKVRNILLRNLGDGTFVNVSDTSGDGLLPRESSRGAAFDDLDNDGDLDAVILNSRSKPTLLRNDSPNENHWVQIELLGRKSNRDAVGSQVRVTAGELTQLSEVHSGRSYQSHFGRRLHFGLGTRERIDRIEVRWLGGTVELFDQVKVDRLLILQEGTGKPSR